MKRIGKLKISTKDLRKPTLGFKKGHKFSLSFIVEDPEKSDEILSYFTGREFCGCKMTNMGLIDFYEKYESLKEEIKTLGHKEDALDYGKKK